jgi:tripeptide aminopeptidase
MMFINKIEEYVSEQTMEQATDVVLQIVKLVSEG